MFCCHWIRAAAAFGALALLTAAPVSAEIYRWVDASGREHFATDLGQVPPAHRAEAVERAKKSRNRVNVVTPPASSSPPAKVQGPTSIEQRREEQEKPGGYGETW